MAMVENPITIRRFRDAISVQDACNPSGIAHSMAEYYKAMLDAGASTYELQNDNAMSLFAMKLLDLGGIMVSSTAYTTRLILCEEKAIHYENNPPNYRNTTKS